jgi:hypothetical protein
VRCHGSKDNGACANEGRQEEANLGNHRQIRWSFSFVVLACAKSTKEDCTEQVWLAPLAKDIKVEAIAPASQ